MSHSSCKLQVSNRLQIHTEQKTFSFQLSVDLPVCLHYGFNKDKKLILWLTLRGGYWIKILFIYSKDLRQIGCVKPDSVYSQSRYHPSRWSQICPQCLHTIILMYCRALCAAEFWALPLVIPDPWHTVTGLVDISTKHWYWPFTVSSSVTHKHHWITSLMQRHNLQCLDLLIDYKCGVFSTYFYQEHNKKWRPHLL